MYPVFPNFKKLNLEDRQQYESLVEAYTPFSDMSFTTLHIWWNLDEKLFFSVLNQNLVLNYYQPFDKPGAGLSLLGNHQVDKSIGEIFEYLKSYGRQQRLVHVPEFVIKEIEAKDAYDISEEADMHEYVMDAAACAKLEGRELGRIRRKVNRFLRETEDYQLELKELDLSLEKERGTVIAAIEDWRQRFPKANDPGRTETDAIKSALKHHRALEIKNLALFIDGKLHGVALFHQSQDRKYYILNHLKVDYSFPFIFDYLTNQVALAAHHNDIPYLNMEMDLGIEGLRQHKLGLRPVDFLKKYSVSPKLTA
jgi:hypothetical protein